MMKFKAGLIGCGYWGPILLRNFNAHRDVEIKTICDHNPLKLKNGLDISPTSKTCQEDDEIFSDPDIDFVIIATQGSSHYNLILKALEAKKHIFVEKPFVLYSSQALDLVARNKVQRLICMVDHTFLFAPQFKEIKKVIANGSLGELRHLYSIRADFGLFQTDVNIFWHLMYHDAYLISCLLGKKEPLEISTTGASHIVDSKEDTAMVSLKYENGMNVNIVNNMMFPIKERKMIITGENAILLWDDMANEDEKLKLFNKSAKYNNNSKRVEYSPQISPHNICAPKTQALQEEVEYFVSCLKKNERPDNDENAGLQVVKFIETIQGNPLA